MFKLNTNFDEEEKKVIKEYGGENCEILSSVDGNSYILNEYGNLFYNDCFKKTDNVFLKQQRYEKVIPNRVIKFYNYFLMETNVEKGIWYRGRMDKNGNWEYDCCCDNLEEVFESL